MIDELTGKGNFKEKVRAILKNGIGHGYPFVIHGALRDREKQRQLVDAGFSRTMRSKHLPGRDGKARAADIVHEGLYWQAGKEFWVMLGRLALTQGCDWGGLWGLDRRTRAKFRKFLTDRAKPFVPEMWHGPLGWDCAHVQSRTAIWSKIEQLWKG